MFIDSQISEYNYKVVMDTSRTINSQSSRLSRHNQRIEQLLARSKSKSKSPYRCHTPKINKQGPMVSRIDTYIKYQHSFFVLNKIMQFKAKQLMSDFMILMKYPQKRQNKIKPSTKFVVIKEPAAKIRSNILLYRLLSIHKSQLKKSLELIREMSIKNKIKEQNHQIENKSKINNSIIKAKIFGISLNSILNKAFKTRKMNGISAILRTKNIKQKILSPLIKQLQKINTRNKRIFFKQLTEISTYKNNQRLKIQGITYKFINYIKYKIIRLGQAYSVIQSKKPQQKDIEYMRTLQYLNLNHVSTLFKKSMKFQLLSAFERLKQNNARKQQIINNKLIQSNSPTKNINKKFPKMCNKFTRFVQIFKAKQSKIYDQIFQILFQNRFDAEQFYFNNQVLSRLYISKAFKKIKNNLIYQKKKQNIEQHLPKLIKIINSKIKVIRCSTFWSMHSNALQIGYEEMEPPVHKCPHGLAHVLKKLFRSRLIEAHLSIKKVSSEYSNIKPMIDDASSIIIYDDMASFLEERQGAFELLKNNYDKLKAMVGMQGESQITSTSFESIKAIHQIKSKMMAKSID